MFSTNCSAVSLPIILILLLRPPPPAKNITPFPSLSSRPRILTRTIHLAAAFKTTPSIKLHFKSLISIQNRFSSTGIPSTGQGMKKMKSKTNTKSKIPILSLFLLAGLSTCFSSPLLYISGDVLSTEASIGRNLLQAKTNCPVNFEFMNYTILTSACKGPSYPPKLCCQAFKDFACPYNDELNDLSNDCSSRMFSYINLYGNYPPGLFAAECRDDKNGLICPALPPGTTTGKNVADSSSSQIVCSPSTLLMLTAGLLILMFRWF